MSMHPAFDPSIVDVHEQKFELSCIPSCVELVLKLLNRVAADYYDEQNSWGNMSGGSFGNFNNRELFGLKFRNLFYEHPRGPEFPLDDLFARVERELDDGRFVIVSLASSSRTCHMYVIHSRDNDEFLSVSKASPPNGKLTITEHEVKAVTTRMGGTDILVYEEL